MIDRLPPQSIEAEQSVLGSILIDRDAVIEVAEFLKPEDFYRQAHAKIYAVILDLFERREPIDIVTVAEALERDRRPGGDRRARLPRARCRTPRRPPSTRPSTRASSSARRVLRNLIGAAGQDRRHRLRGPGGGPGGDRPRGGRSCSPSASGGSAAGFSPLETCSTTRTTGSTTCTRTAARSAASGRGSSDLDTLTTGLQKSDLVILAARPSIGKTSFALNIAEHAAVAATARASASSASR